MPRTTGLLTGAVTIGLAALLAGCASSGVVAPTGTYTAEPTTTATADAATATPSPSASDEEPRPMEVGDCLNKVGVDDLGLPIPQYLDCAQPHMFEVTAIVTIANTSADFAFEALDDARKARCRGEYESYTGRSTRDVGNAFGWDQPTEAAWKAGVDSYPCYATAPLFGDLTGSLAR